MCSTRLTSLHYQAIPVYQSEMSTPATRGFMVSMHGIMIAIGYLLSSWIGFGVYFITANGSDSSFPWRFPISFQIVPAILLLVGSPRLPFSPRWLVQKGRYEEAKEVLRSLHTLKDSDDHTISNREFDQIRQQTAADLAVKEHTTWYELVRTPGNRKRALIAVFLFWGNQMTGNLVIANYGTIIFASLGMTGYMPLLLLALWIVVSVGGNTICALFLDRFGRRNFMLVGIAGMFAALLGECITQAVSVNNDPNSNIPGKRAAAFFLFLWIAFYSSCQDGTQYVYLAEIYPNYLRGQGTAFGIFNLFIASIVVLVAAPTAFSSKHPFLPSLSTPCKALLTSRVQPLVGDFSLSLSCRPSSTSGSCILCSPRLASSPWRRLQSCSPSPLRFISMRPTQKMKRQKVSV